MTIKVLSIPTLGQVTEAFLKAMAHGYARTDCSPSIRTELPGVKETVFHDGDWLVIDRWVTTKLSNRSAGFTTIWFQCQAVWIMNYCGWYQKKEVPLLKKALRQAYVINRCFVGGRGPVRMIVSKKRRLTYHNKVITDEAGSFRGEEWIQNARGRHYGYHQYSGMSLVPVLR